MIINDQDVRHRARYVGRWYAERVYWTDIDDLTSEAVLAQLEAARWYEPGRGSWSAYAHKAAVRAVRDVLRLRYPVSGPRRHVNAAAELRSTAGVALRDDHAMAPSPLRDAVRRQIRDRIEALLGPDAADFAVAVLSGEVRPAEAAADTGADVDDVYRAERRLRKVLRADDMLRQLWEET